MTAGFGSLAVVRVQVAPGCFVATLPMPRATAELVGEQLRVAIAETGDSPQLVPFDTGDVAPCWLRARAVLTVEVLATEDPS